MTTEEQEYWIKHYPHEAETIIALCDLFDEAQDEAVKAQISYAIGVLRKKEKYAFHDLQKNPEDLPEIGMYVDTRMISCETGMIVPRYACLWEFCNQMMWKDVRHGGYEYKACVAWRYIDPLEDAVGAIEQGGDDDYVTIRLMR